MKYSILLFLTTVFAQAQNDTINLLNEVKLYGNFSPKINAGYHIQIISDSVINNTHQSLGNLLQNKANIYFKQNGNGMVSSISLRGSGASHTGIYWNGITINSSLNGQTDFNTLSANGYNQIEIRKGAGSVLFGSGAIGGAINLRDKIYFINKKEFVSNIGYASYNTQNIFVQTKLNTTKFYSKISFEKIKSENDYPYLNTNLINENGAYKNYHIKGALAYKLNTNNQIQLFTTYSNNERELSRTITAPSNSKYKNEEQRIMLHWKNFGNKYNSSLKLAYLDETYKYYFNKEDIDYSYGESKNYIAKYDFSYFIKNKISIHTGLENKLIKGSGKDITKAKRNIFETYMLIHQQPIKKINYNVSIRKGFSKTYDIPFIYAVDTKYSITSKTAIKANYSTNYKLPTFNDLYWSYSGNEKLLSENSKTLELGFDYQTKNTIINITTYHTNSNNLIQWRPTTNIIWKPINIQKVTSTGVEFVFNTIKKVNKNQFEFSTQYAYTISEDLHKKKQLIYVPYHKANASINYLYKGFGVNINQQYNGAVFTTTSNTQTVEHFWLTNIQISKKIIKNKINIGLVVNNIFNKAYQTVAYRPMPNRNLKLSINIKI